MLLPNQKEASTRDKREYNKIEYQKDKSLINKYSNLTYHIKTYGCQMNEHDSENISALLEELGLTKEEEYEKADVILLNTCSIRENANNKAFGMLGRLKHLKEERKEVIIGICGCMAQEESVANDLLNKYKFVDFVFGTHNLNSLPTLLNNTLEKDSREFEVFSREQDLIEGLPVKRDNKYKAYVNIIYGCDKFCTYCIVPYTRGKQRSRAKEDILKEIDSIIKEGYQEVTLLGQNVNAYGKDLYNDYSMTELLEDIAKTNIPRIRFVTSHPWDFEDKMIDVIGKYSNIMPSIHLPLQSGSSKILKLMGRRYTKESYLELFHKLKKAKNCVISTDIIVGFPTETKEDFEQTLEVVKECKFDNAFTFIYSKRTGTPAASMEDDVTVSEKEERLQILNKEINKYFKENNDKLLNQEVDVLLEGESTKKEGLLVGYTDTNKLINVKGDKSLIGTIVKVKITNAKTWSLDGEIIER